jgi:hypothetical protein
MGGQPGANIFSSGCLSYFRLTQVATDTDHVILSEVRAKNLRIVWPIVVDSLEILRRCAPQNDMTTNG